MDIMNVESGNPWWMSAIKRKGGTAGSYQTVVKTKLSIAFSFKCIMIIS